MSHTFTEHALALKHRSSASI